VLNVVLAGLFSLGLGLRATPLCSCHKESADVDAPSAACCHCPAEAESRTPTARWISAETPCPVKQFLSQSQVFEGRLSAAPCGSVEPFAVRPTFQRPADRPVMLHVPRGPPVV
jgi:hypothetical protein